MAALPLPRRTRGGRNGSLFFITVAARRGSGSFQKKKIFKTREFTQNFHFKERYTYTVKLDEFPRLEAIALV